MVLLLCFALAYAVTGAAGQVGRDARGGMRSIRDRAWASASHRVGNMRASGPRDAGWWLWLTGATAYHTARYTARGSRRVYRSVRTGWSAGWARGTDRHATWTANRAARTGNRGPARRFADRWRTTRGAQTAGPVDDGRGAATRGAGEPGPTDQDRSPHPRWTDAYEPPVPAERQGDDQDAAITLLRCEVCGVYVTGTHTCTRTPEAPPLSERMQLESGDRHGAGATTGTGGTRMGEITGEAPNIEAARDTLAALQGEADRTVARVDQLSASLHSADLDSQTLSDVAAVLEAADVMKAAAHQALTGLASRHQLMEEAVNNTAHAAKTDWYRHG